MQLKNLFSLAIILLVAACQTPQKEALDAEQGEQINQPDLPDSLSARRIAFVLDLKQAVAKAAWPDFGKKASEGTLIYFDGDRSEIFFPTPLVISKLKAYERHSADYIITSRTDSFPYHMENMLSFEDGDSAYFFYYNPVEQYSSVEEIGNFIPSVESTEMWASMVIHEMFHHYQFNNQRFKAYAESPISTLPFNPRHMSAICKEDEEFLPMIRAENELLMEAIEVKDQQIIDSLTLLYLESRRNRMAKYSQEHPELEQVENFYVIQEGSARYIEYQSMLIMSDYFGKENATKIADDPRFYAFREFQEVDLSNPAFNYLIYAAPSDYHYVIGFNIMRLLDKLGVEYKQDLLNNPDKALHQYLQDNLNSHPK